MPDSSDLTPDQALALERALQGHLEGLLQTQNDREWQLVSEGSSYVHGFGVCLRLGDGRPWTRQPKTRVSPDFARTAGRLATEGYPQVPSHIQR